jgi:hypothetical protein
MVIFNVHFAVAGTTLDAAALEALGGATVRLVRAS